MSTKGSTHPFHGYEVTFITHPEIAEANLKALKEKLATIVGTFSGEVVLVEDWGRKKFAYPIHKQTRGQYTYMVYQASGSAVAEIERNLKLHEHVIRFLTVQLPVPFSGVDFKKTRTAYYAAVKRREEEREQRREAREDARRGYDRHQDSRFDAGEELE
jgi:small subunit ribosomal protein S6